MDRIDYGWEVHQDEDTGLWGWKVYQYTWIDAPGHPGDREIVSKKAVSESTAGYVEKDDAINEARDCIHDNKEYQ